MRVAVIAMAVLGVLLLASSLLTWFGRETVVDRFVTAQPELSRADVTRFLLLGLARDLLVGLVAVGSAIGVSRRWGPARWTGVAATLFLGLLTLFSVVSAGGTTPYSLLVVVLCAASASSLLARTTAEWAPTGASRGGRAGRSG